MPSIKGRQGLGLQTDAPRWHVVENYLRGHPGMRVHNCREEGLLTTPEPGIQQVPQGVAEHIEAEHRGAQGYSWPDG
jgi:hypothetical protein